MITFQIGDEVRVAGVPGSQWHGSVGVVVKIYDRRSDDGNDVQECAVQFSFGQRWFLAAHLTRSVPDRTRRFFRGEALNRWNAFSPDDVVRLNGGRTELIALLQERYGLAFRRATSEADAFIADIESRIRSAVATVNAKPQDGHPDALKLSA